MLMRIPSRRSRRIQSLVHIVGLLACCCLSACAVAEEEGEAKAPATQEPATQEPATQTPATQEQEKKKNTKKNRLAKETSPYLLSHSTNPVDWYPWGDEAFAKAKKEGKLVFLSVGYSSCHWCHVMEHESFTDEEIAAFLNKHYVCIKVDREERPDVDEIYMTSVQIVTGRGGWPMSVFMTADGKPFFGGTYFPARDGDRPGSGGFLSLITNVQEMWKTKPDAVRKGAEQLTQAVRTQLAGRKPLDDATIDAELLQRGLAGLADQYDPKFGGFGYAPTNPRRPKFPEPPNLFFLLDRVKRDGDKQAKEMLVGTLEQMARGGIYDHLGGGFHRYSVDRFWYIPHFEKMLYDNGQLTTLYAEVAVMEKRDDFRRLVDESLEFVLREMTDEKGGFYSALDADSEGEEGAFYRWEKEEVQKLLSKDEMSLFAAVYGLNDPPNFEGEYYAPQPAKPLREVAVDRGVTESELLKSLAPIRKKLFEVRSKRPRPRTDTKVLSSWNGLMIRGFADAGRLLKNPKYIEAAETAANFILSDLRTKDGRLLRTYGEGKAKLNGYLDDYAFVVDGLIALHRATGDQKWLTAAGELTDKQLELFWDKERGGFFFTSSDHEVLLARTKDPVDGVQPSGNSVSALNLLYLAKALKKPEYRQKAEGTIRSGLPILQRSPTASTYMLTAVAEWLEEEG